MGIPTDRISALDSEVIWRLRTLADTISSSYLRDLLIVSVLEVRSIMLVKALGIICLILLEDLGSAVLRLSLI